MKILAFTIAGFVLVTLILTLVRRNRTVERFCPYCEKRTFQVVGKGITGFGALSIRLPDNEQVFSKPVVGKVFLCGNCHHYYDSGDAQFIEILKRDEEQTAILPE